jgi:hypothetical protein
MWAIFNMIAAFFKSVSSTADLAKAAQPTPKEREKRLEIDTPLMEVEKNIVIANKIFNRVKNNPEANILDEIRALTSLSGDDEWAMYNSIEKRVANHRKKHPIISGWRRFEKNRK